jgi:peptidoglycan hydrolase-like protein with peptidoglycan-binding domain
MKLLSAVLFSLVLAAPAFAETKAKQKAEPKPNPIAASYAAMTPSERMSIQSDLVWAGHYNGVINGEFGDRAIAAVKAFQAKNGTKQTGVLNPQERGVLQAAAKTKSDAVGWRVVDDLISGVRVGVPLKLAPQIAQAKSGTRWSSARGEVQIESFRIREAGTTLAAVFEAQKNEQGRKVNYQVLRPDFFVVSGLQNLKKFYVRANVREGDVRGVTILYDQAMDGIMEPVVVAISSAFNPFPAGVALAPPPRRKVEYASGIVVSASGHIVTDREALEACHVVTVAGIGGADRVAEDKVNGLALLRVYGAANLKPLGLASESAKSGDVTVVGIADPQAQAGSNAVTAARAKIAAANDTRVVEPAPAFGFTGAAVLDAQGRLTGMAALKVPVVAGPAPASPQASLVPVEAIRALLEAENLARDAAASGAEAAKASVVRVICVRK